MLSSQLKLVVCFLSMLKHKAHKAHIAHINCTEGCNCYDHKVNLLEFRSYDQMQLQILIVCSQNEKIIKKGNVFDDRG